MVAELYGFAADDGDWDSHGAWGSEVHVIALRPPVCGCPPGQQFVRGAEAVCWYWESSAFRFDTSIRPELRRSTELASDRGRKVRPPAEENRACQN
jgi:hypothetical protein